MTQISSHQTSTLLTKSHATCPCGSLWLPRQGVSPPPALAGCVLSPTWVSPWRGNLLWPCFPWLLQQMRTHLGWGLTPITLGFWEPEGGGWQIQAALATRWLRKILSQNKNYEKAWHCCSVRKHWSQSPNCQRKEKCVQIWWLKTTQIYSHFL